LTQKLYKDSRIKNRITGSSL